MGGSECPDEDRGVRVTQPAVIGSGVIQEFVDGYLVPIDPMDDLHCDGCQ